MKIKKMTFSEKKADLHRRIEKFYKDNPHVQRQSTKPKSKYEESFEEKIKKVAEKMRGNP